MIEVIVLVVYNLVDTICCVTMWPLGTNLKEKFSYFLGCFYVPQKMPYVEPMHGEC